MEEPKKEMLPEVKEYLRELKAAETASLRALTYPPTGKSASENFPAAREELVRQKDLAWLKLGQNASTPLVSWIVRNANDYRGYASWILGLLPATLEEMDQFAEASGWCGVWEGFRSRAVEDGMVSEYRSPAYLALRRFVSGRLQDSDTEHLMELLDEFVKESSAVSEG